MRIRASESIVIEADQHSWHVKQKVKKKKGSGDRWKSIGWYPSLSVVIDRLVRAKCTLLLDDKDIDSLSALSEQLDNAYKKLGATLQHSLDELHDKQDTIFEMQLKIDEANERAARAEKIMLERSKS